jgi:hypothetical protein
MAATSTRERPAAPVPSTKAFRLPRRAHQAALTVHILTSVGWFGIAIVVAFCGIVGSSTGDGPLAHALFRAMEISPWLSIPFGLAAAASGVVLSLGTKYGLIRYWWVVIKIAITIAVIATDAVLIRVVAHDAVVSAHATNPLVHGTIAHVVVLTIATVLSVYKPRARTPRGRRVLALPK